MEGEPFQRFSGTAGPKESFYVIVPTVSPDRLRDALALGYGMIGRVGVTYLIVRAIQNRRVASVFSIR